jgi:hypothetical protein
MVVVGYNDDLGAFKLINSWGTGWSSSGFGWLSYSYFPQVVREGFVAKDATNGPLPVPAPKPAPGPAPAPPAPVPPAANAERAIIRNESGERHARDVALGAGRCVEDVLDAEAPLPRWHGQPRERSARATAVSRPRA